MPDIDAHVYVAYDIYIYNEQVSDYVAWEIHEKASSCRSAGGVLEGGCKLSLDFSLSAIVSDAWYEGYRTMLAGRAACLWGIVQAKCKGLENG